YQNWEVVDPEKWVRDGYAIVRVDSRGATCLESGCHTIFEEASPTFKKRFMWMSDYTDEAEFDRFVRSLTWEGHAERILVPYICAGECEELSPLVDTEQMFSTMMAPRQLAVYQESRHAVGNVPSCRLGPFPVTLVADWMAARLEGKPMVNERWFVESSGNVVKTAH
ncbi:MAG: hypothetical protein ACRD9W_09520, partial [Terriglobia bacterium]